MVQINLKMFKRRLAEPNHDLRLIGKMIPHLPESDRREAGMLFNKARADDAKITSKPPPKTKPQMVGWYGTDAWRVERFEGEVHFVLRGPWEKDAMRFVVAGKNLKERVV